jgi:hypothetical protein
VVFFQAFYNFARPHQSLRLPLPAREQPGVGLIRPKGQPRTPGMAAGLTNPVWTFRELLTAKFEPILNKVLADEHLVARQIQKGGLSVKTARRDKQPPVTAMYRAYNRMVTALVSR